MDKIIGYLVFTFRLAFLPLQKHLLKKKHKIALLISSNVIMMYAVFIVSIPPRKTIFTRVNEVYGTEQAILDEQEKRIQDIILRHRKQLLPQMITIIPTRTLEAQQTSDSINAHNGLSLTDEEFLVALASAKNNH